MRNRKKLIIGLIFLFAAVFVYHTRFSKKVFIDPIDYDVYNKSVPLSQAECTYNSSLQYYFYENSDGAVKNNKFGLYIYPDNERFIELADQLVNSNGGAWGYVLMPYNVQDYDRDKWNRVFYLLNKKQLIPVVQLYDVDPDNYEKQTKKAAEFLNSFIWPVRQKYISVYNEPNDAKFWYGRVDVEEYTEILDFTIDTFKAENEDFFMMNGGFNVSAPNNSAAGYMDSLDYMSAMESEKPGIFAKLDGWASHPYPQPNFSGSPESSGRWSIRAYENELSHLKNLGVKKELPVFITETGWAHDVGKNFNNSYLSIDDVAENFKKAYEDVWLKDERVVAVMPFTIWYEAPHDHFTWVDSRYIPYKHFEVVKGMKKVAGTPEKLATAHISQQDCE